jgi:hypothetical protein
MIVDNSVADGLTAAEMTALEEELPRNFCVSFRDRHPTIGLNEAHVVYKELRQLLGLV